MDPKEKEALQAEVKAKEGAVKAAEEKLEAAKREFDAKIANAEARVAEKENEAIARVKKMESERRSERIDSWIDARAKEGKLAPVERGRVKALLEHADDTAVLTYSVEDGKGPREAKSSPATLIKEFIEQRPSLFRQLSNADGDDSEQLDDVGAEMDRRARKYVEEKKVSYVQALTAVGKEDPELYERWVLIRQ